MRRAAATALLLALSVAACGGSSEKDDEFEQSVDAMPACDDVWVAGSTLPQDYEGCTRSDDAIEAAVLMECESGAGQFTSFDDRFYANLGGPIAAMSGNEDPAYTAAYEECLTAPK